MSELNSALEHPTYNYKVVRQFAIMTVVLSLIHISEPTRLWSGSRMPSSA